MIKHKIPHCGNTKYHTVGTVLISSFFVDQCILGRNKGPRIFIRPNNMGFTEAMSVPEFHR